MSADVISNREIHYSKSSNPSSPCKLDSDRRSDFKSMEYHRQLFKSKIDESTSKQIYVSPSDTIMSPCTAKLSAYRSKQVGKAKPKSLFAKASTKNLVSTGSPFGVQDHDESSPKEVIETKIEGV